MLSLIFLQIKNQQLLTDFVQGYVKYSLFVQSPLSKALASMNAFDYVLRKYKIIR